MVKHVTGLLLAVADTPDGLGVFAVETTDGLTRTALTPLDLTRKLAALDFADAPATSIGAPGAITVLAASERGGLLNAPDCYMEKIVVGPSCKNAVELDAPVADNLKNIAKRLVRDVEDHVV